MELCILLVFVLLKSIRSYSLPIKKALDLIACFIIIHSL